MNVPDGFKQTEVGVIPDDWETNSIENLIVPNGLIRGPFGGSLKKSCFVKKGIKVYEQRNAIYKDEKIGRYYIDDQKYNELKRFEVYANDFIVSCSGTIGKIYQIPSKFERGVINQALLKITIDISRYSDQYFYQFFQWDNFQNRIIESTQGGAMKNLIGMADFKKVLIPLPPTRAEQTAIAAALSDMDALIESVEKLLEKKRRIKQGAMQELLRPKEGWKIHKLDELCTPSKKRIDPKISQQVYKCVELEHIGQESGRLLGYAFTDELKSQKTLFNAGDTLFGKLRPYLKKFFFAGFDGCCTTEIWALQPANYIYGKLLFYIIQTDAVLEAANQSEGTKMPRADWKKVKEVKVSIPQKPEQERIAAVLSDMDSEIEQLETQLAKYRQLKTGMMQELLTGKKRLV